jgi:ribosome-associated translation inhibitor RaiA
LPSVKHDAGGSATMNPCSPPTALDERNAVSTPISINFVHMDRSDALEVLLRERAGKLGRVHPAITACNVAVQADGRHKHQGRKYAVKLDIHLKGKQVAINHIANEDPFVAARDVFDAARRALDADSEIRQGH